MSPSEFLLPAGCDVLITELVMTEHLLVVVATPTATAACCPICQAVSDRIHSRYRRTVGDLPLGGRQLVLRLVARRFFCPNAACSRRVFCERLPNLVAAHARSTRRLQALQRSLGATAGGEPGSRLARDLATPVSGDTLLRRVRAAPHEPGPPVRHLGIDDFAFRKGQHYGTILIDLDRGRVVDLLRSRESADVEAWLKARPGIEIITRDRAAAYANAASNGAPQAMQVADRWHLMKNLREAVERVLDRRHPAVRACLKSLPSSPPAPDPSTTPDPPKPERPAPRPLTPREQTREARRQQRHETFGRVHALHAAGTSNRQIAAMLRLDRDTVTRYLRAECVPERRTPSPRRTATYREYLDRKLSEGCRNAAALHRELIADGQAVSYYAVRRYVRRRLLATGRASGSNTPPGDSASRLPTAKQLSFLIVRRPEEREDEEQATVEALTSLDAAMATALALVVQLAAMIRGVSQLPLAEWLATADASDCAELQGFARTLHQDAAAVEAALTTPWSNGPVEGQVNRLKLIKRQMYGRAGFDLLRARVCAA